MSAWGQQKRANLQSHLTDGAPSDGGFALVDSLTALLILSVAVALSLQAGEVALKGAREAAEIQDARSALSGLMEQRTKLPAAGASPTLAWRILYQTTSTVGSFKLCRRTAQTVSLHTGRTFSAETLEPCIPGDVDGR